MQYTLWAIKRGCLYMTVAVANVNWFLPRCIECWAV